MAVLASLPTAPDGARSAILGRSKGAQVKGTRLEGGALARVLGEDGALFHDKKGRVREMPVPLAPLADTHGHLFPARSADPAAELARAALAGVALLVVPLDPTEMATATEALDALSAWQEEAQRLVDACVAEGAELPRFSGEAPSARMPSRLRIVAGVHPYGAASIDDDCLARLRRLLADPRCCGVGEFGLDFGPYNELAPEVQEQAFRMQLRMAHELGLPCELHVRDAKGDPTCAAHALAERVLFEEGVPEAGCDLHCFTSGPDVLEGFARLGCHIAFGGAVTFLRSDDIREAAAACPEELLLAETDAPYMAPVPLRGMECESAMVGFSAACVADVRLEALGIPRERTYRALWENACVFVR
jgi:TatD DNase family protein